MYRYTNYNYKIWETITPTSWRDKLFTKLTQRRWQERESATTLWEPGQIVAGKLLIPFNLLVNAKYWGIKVQYYPANPKNVATSLPLFGIGSSC